VYWCAVLAAPVSNQAMTAMKPSMPSRPLGVQPLKTNQIYSLSEDRDAWRL